MFNVTLPFGLASRGKISQHNSIPLAIYVFVVTLPVVRFHDEGSWAQQSPVTCWQSVFTVTLRTALFHAEGSFAWVGRAVTRDSQLSHFTSPTHLFLLLMLLMIINSASSRLSHSYHVAFNKWMFLTAERRVGKTGKRIKVRVMCIRINYWILLVSFVWSSFCVCEYECVSCEKLNYLESWDQGNVILIQISTGTQIQAFKRGKPTYKG